MRKIGSFFSRVFSGCHGLDDLGRLNLWLFAAFCILKCVGYISGSSFLTIFSQVGYILLAVIFFFRLLSKNEVRRAAENNRYLNFIKKVRDGMKLLKNRIRDRRTHIYRKCPACGAVLRLKKIRGDHRAACPKCGNSFDIKVR